MEEGGVIEFADACSKPNTVVVETKNAVVAIMAVGRPHWSKDVARLAVLQLVSVRVAPNRAVVLSMQVKYLRVIGF